jgi:Ca-activated chloride channel family protein
MIEAVRWDHPTFLLALLAAPALAAFFVWAAGRRARALATFVAANLLPVVAPDVDPRRRRLRAMLIVAAVACLGLALGGPRWGFRWEELRREGIDIVVALDTSRSMLATDVKPNRMTRAKLAIRDLADAASNDRLALVPFAGSAFVQCPLTLDHAAFLESLQATDVGIIPRGGTALAVAIDASLGAFEGREGRHQAIVLLTDGESHEGDWKAAVGRAKERGVAIFTVGIGTVEGELLPAEQGPGFFKDRRGQAVKSRLDQATLEEVAVDTGGVYLHLAGGTGVGLAELYRDHIAKLDPRELGSTLEKRYELRYRWPLLVALLLLAVEPLVADRRPAGSRRGRRFWRVAQTPAAALVLAALSVGWLDPNAKAREGVTLYEEGKFPEAAQAWNEALVDAPESPALHYDLGAAFYRQGKWDEALASYEKVPTGPGDDPGRTARTWYNLGNTRVRQGEAAEKEKPQETLQLWDEALVAYRRALTADPSLADAKYNLELVAKKRAALEEKLKQQQEQQQQDQQDQQDQQQGEGENENEQQDQKQEQQQQPPGEEQQPGEQPEEGEQPQDQQQPSEGEQQPEEQQPQDGEEPQPAEGEQPPSQPEQQQAQQPSPSEGEPSEQPPQGSAGAAAGERRDGEMSPEEAEALLDAQRAEEVSPEDIARRMQQGRVVEPAQDW